MTKHSINKVLTDPSLLGDYFGFYDWFCYETSLEARSKTLLTKLKFCKQGLVDGDKNYVWFKNNCPMSGSTYDDIRISTINGENFLGGFCPRSGHKYADKLCSFWLLYDEEGLVEEEFDNWAAFKAHVKTADMSKVKQHFS
jgi:hypothetical protein